MAPCQSRRSWQRCVMVNNNNYSGENIILYGAAMYSYVEHFGDGSLEAKKIAQFCQNSVWLFDT